SGLTAGDLAGAFHPLNRLRRTARRAGRGLARGAKLAARAHPLYLTAQAGNLAAKAAAFATGPIRRRIFRALFKTLIARRARLLAWQRRRQLNPAPAEVTEARRWAAAYVRRKGILGKLISSTLSGDLGAEPVTATLITASIPLLLSLARK